MPKDIYLILDNIRSRENVGSIFRTADAFGVKKIFLCGITPQPKSDQDTRNKLQEDRIAKTALGAEKHVPYEYIRNTWRIVTKLKNEGIMILALEQTENSENILMFGGELSRHNFKQIALMVGNEVRGISPKILKYCDKKISIPMYGKKESLNVSVATGIALYVMVHPSSKRDISSQGR